jgi:hypothetical protein
VNNEGQSKRAAQTGVLFLKSHIDVPLIELITPAYSMKMTGLGLKVLAVSRHGFI